jgi:putative ABC transport system permease protein
MPRHAVSPPAVALWLLAHSVPPGDREMVIGDLTELFADRLEGRHRFNRLWFCAQACLFALAATTARAQPDSPHSSWRDLMGRFMGRFGSGVRHAVRRLRYDWRYSAGVILILGVGIGPAAAMWSVVDRVLLRPLDYRDPDELGLIRIHLGQISNHPGLSHAEVTDLRNSGIFQSVETERRQSEVSFGPATNLIAFSEIAITTGMLPMLGVTPVIGRSFTEDDFNIPPPPPAAVAAVSTTGSVPGAPIRILIDYTTWQTHFGGDPGVLTRLTEFSGRPAEIIGVLPKGFRLITGRAVPRRIDVYTPLRLGDTRNAWQFPTLARVKPGTTFAQAQAGLDTLAARLKSQYPQIYDSGLRFTIAPALEDMTRETTPALRAAIAGVLLLLLIAFANATALVVARLRTRERDLAIRSAIGASRPVLVGEVVTESAVLAIGGAAAGSMLALWAIVAIRQMIPRTVPRWDDIAVGWNLVLYAGGLALVGLVCLGLIPMWKTLRRDAWQSLGFTSVQSGRAEGTLSRLVLVGSQIALTVVLGFACMQLVRSASRLNRVDLGFDPHVLTLRVPFDGRRWGGPDKRSALYQQIRDQVGQVPGVVSVGVVTHLPLGDGPMVDGYQADLTKETSFDQSANYQSVTPGYFATLRIPILQGRDITDTEGLTLQNVAVVDETLVKAVFPDVPNVLGRTLRLGWQIGNVQIVGVVGHARTVEVGRAVRPQVYVPISRLFPSGGAGFVIVRTAGDPLPLAGAISEAIRDAGPGRAISNVSMLTDNVASATSTLRAVTGLVTALAVSAGLLSAIGLYLVIAFVVHQRRRSTAIRAALGATRGQVMWHHFKIGAVLLLVALPVGLLLSSAVSPLFGTLVYGVGPRDVVSLLSALGLAIAASLLGMYVPVRRAAAANVVTVLRETV